MKHLLFLLFFAPLGVIAQTNVAVTYDLIQTSGPNSVAIGFEAAYPDTVTVLLHKYTDSFFYFRCREKCASAKGLQDSTAFYSNARQYYYHKAYDTYVRWDLKRYDQKKQKRNLRFMDPDKYYKCSCK
jgi:hypothetical protein